MRIHDRNGVRFLGLGQERAFTMVELLVVILIIGILVLSSFAIFGQTDKAHDTAARSNLVHAYKAAYMVYMFNGHSCPGDEPLAQRTGEAEPSVAVVPGRDYAEKKVSVECVSDDEIWLRTRSLSGNRYRLKILGPGEMVREWAPDTASSSPIANLFVYPSFELNPMPGGLVAQFGANESLSGQDFAHKHTGTRSYCWNRSGATFGPQAWIRFPSDSPEQRANRVEVEPGKTYTASFWVLVPGGAPAVGADPQAKIVWYAGDDATSSSPPATVQRAVGDWVQVAITATAPPDAETAVIEVGWSGEGAQPAPGMFHLCFDSFLFIEGTSTDYFDGESDGAEWEGQRHFSRSLITSAGGQGEGEDGYWRPW